MIIFAKDPFINLFGTRRDRDLAREAVIARAGRSSAPPFGFYVFQRIILPSPLSIFIVNYFIGFL